jgi:hypothetical protein
MQASKLGVLEIRSHLASIATLGLEAMAKMAPEVSFIHAFPGPVKSGIERGSISLLLGVIKVSVALGMFGVSVEECGVWSVENDMFFGEEYEVSC